MSGQLRASAGSVLVNGRDVTRSSAPQRARLGHRARLPADEPVPQPQRRRERAPRHAGARRHPLRLLRAWLDRRDLINKADATLALVGLLGRARLSGRVVVAWRPAQARSRHDDGAGAGNSDVRRADRRHERRRGPGRARPHRPAQTGQDQDDPARRAQDGRRPLARRPHHRARQRPAFGRWPACGGDRLADRAGGLSRHRARRARR